MAKPTKLEDFTFRSEFSVLIKPLVSEEKDKFLALASLAEIGKYVPQVDTATNVDLLPFACNAFVANRVNKNDDVADAATSVSIARSFKFKPVNIEHNRSKVMGVILTYAFTKFGSNEAMTEAEALKSIDPFNVTLGGLLWRVVNPEAAQAIEDSSDPASENFETISASWEVGFMDYSLASIEGNSKNLADATIITDPEQIKTLSPYLKAFGGKGKDDKKNRLYRHLTLGSLPLGIGLTETPAAEVKGIATQKTAEIPNTKSKASEETPVQNDVTASADATNNQNNQENISQTEKNVVIVERKAIANMSVKITKLEDITDDVLKQVTASELTQWVKDQLGTADKNYQAEKLKLEQELKASKDSQEKLTAEQLKIQEELKKVSASLEVLAKEKDARIKQDRFDSRMAALDAEFTLTDAEREVIASDIPELSDEAFAAHKKKLDVFLAAKKKTAQATAAPAVAPALVVAPVVAPQTAVASTTDGQAVVDAALDNAEKGKAQIPATASAEVTGSVAKFAKAFGADQWISDVKLTD